MVAPNNPPSLIKCDSWPNVLPNDNGIRPAGSPDHCFYCRQRVGQPHAKDCVTIQSRTRYIVSLIDGGERVGTYRHEDPASWDVHMREFHKNDGTWCTDNAMDEVEWVSEEAEARVLALIGEGCGCWTLEFRVEEIEDAGPLIQPPSHP